MSNGAIRIHVMPTEQSELELNKQYTLLEYKKISKGYLSSRSNGWYIFMELDWVFFYKIQTGFCIYRMKLMKNGNKYNVGKVYVNRNPEQYTHRRDMIQNDFDCIAIKHLIDHFLLS